MPIDTPRKDVTDRTTCWQRLRDCLDGADAVKARGPVYLPLLSGMRDSDQEYVAYKARADFFNATARTQSGLEGAVFRRPPAVEGVEAIAADLTDVTLDGRSLEAVSRVVVREVLGLGRYGMWLDMPRADATPAADGVIPAKPRPYWVRYNAEQIVNWRERVKNGKRLVTLVVLRECSEEADPKDPYVGKETTRFRELRLNDVGNYEVRIHVERQTTDQFTGKTTTEYVLDPAQTVVPERRGTAFDFIPFVFFGPWSNDPTIEKPPLYDLALLNLSHYRSSADLEHGAHFTALPTPWVVGGPTGNTKLRIGSGTAWLLQKDGKAGMLEFTGTGLGALEKRLEAKANQMAALGARLIESQPTAQAETAEAVRLRHSGDDATLGDLVDAVAIGLTTLLRWHLWWAGFTEDLADEKVTVALNKVFVDARMKPEELKALMLAYQGGGISFETWYAALERGEYARPGVTAEDEKKAIEEEAAAQLEKDIDRIEKETDVKPPAPPGGRIA